MTEEEKKALELAEAEKARLAAEDIKQVAIDELKAKLDASIDPIEHAKLKADYKKLMEDFVNKRPAPIKKELTFRPANEIAKELANIEDGDISNRSYIEKSVEYRESYMHEFGKDPWTDFSLEGSGEATEKTIKLAKAYKQLLEENPSPVEFRMKMESVLRDDPKVLAALRAKNKKHKN